MPDNKDASLSEVPVIQRALVKILARYPGEFDVLRELIQNADDANAPVVEVHFETVKSQLTGGPDDLSKRKVRKWIIRNKGSFQQKDWERLGKIAAGNDDSTKVGAFGVGFYSVLSKSHQPVVKSDGKSLQFRWNDDGNLCTESSCCAKDEWTSIELELKIEESLPDLVNLARFLVSSVASLTNIDTISVLLDGQQLLHIRKEASESTVDVPVPEHLMRATRSQVLAVESIQRTVQKVRAGAAKWIFASSSTSLSTPADPEDALPERLGNSVADDVAPALSTVAKVMLQENAITHDLYTAKIRVNLDPDTKMKEEVQSSMKSLPSSFECKLIYFNSEQYDALQHLSKSQLREANHLVRPFFGSHGIFPENCGRLFIGQSTTERTGIGLHISAHFLPTMERGSIDLTNGKVAEWNKEVLWVGGLLARIIYEAEMRKAADSGDGTATKLGLHTMARFAFGSFAKHGRVSLALQDAFFSCSDKEKPPFPVVSDTGILCLSGSQFRQINKDLSFLKTYRTLHEELKPSQRDEIIKRYKIRTFTSSDIVQEFEAGITREVIKLFFDWWEGAKSDPRGSDDMKRKFCKRIASMTVLHVSEEVKVPLKNIKHFTFFPLSDDLCPKENLCIDITSTRFTRDTIQSFGWTQLPLLHWLEYACSQAQQHVPMDPDFNRRVSHVLVQFALVEELLAEKRNQAADRMKDMKCIPTNKGLMSPAESYFVEADICGDIPVANEDDFRDIPSTPVAEARGFSYKIATPEHIRDVLSALRVRREMEWPDLVERLETSASEESNVHLLRYLAAHKEKRTGQYIKDLKTKSVFYSRNHGRVSASQLHFPTEDIIKLDLPIIALSQAGTSSLLSNGIPRDSLEQFLESLGIQGYPSLNEIIELAASGKPEVQPAALQYLLSNFETRYDTYKPDNFADKAFIPTNSVLLARPSEVLASSVWEELGFKQTSLRSRDLLKLCIRESPSIETIVKRLETPEDTLPDPDAARLWFGHLFRYGNFSPLRLRDQFSKIRFVPVESLEAPSSEPSASTMKYLPPKECFTSPDTKEHARYRNIFSFVDFGPDGNSFLESCCAKKSPEATDIVRKIVQDPEGYFKALGDDIELYREELRTIASRIDFLSDDDKKAMRGSSMFLASRQHEDDGKLLPAHKVVIGDWESRDFGGFVFLAPNDDAIEKLYRKMGSEYLGTYVQCDVVPNCPSNRYQLPFDRGQVIRRIQYFMRKREKSEKTDVSFYEEGSAGGFRVRACKTLTLKKTFAPRGEILVDGVDLGAIKPKVFQVKAGFKLDELTLWVVEGSGNSADLCKDAAVALCRVLLKSFGPNDVLLLASLIKMESGRLESYYGRAEKSTSRGPKESRQTRRNMVPVPEPIARLSVVPSMITQAVSRQRIPPEQDMKNAIASLRKSGADNKHPDFSTRCRRHNNQFKKHNHHCKEAHKIMLDTERKQQDDDTGIEFFFTQSSRCQPLPDGALQEFAKLISDLAHVFGEGVSRACYIFWKDGDEDLMAFNRDQKYIFFNLAHYHKFFRPRNSRDIDKEKKAFTEWFLIMAHEIAHNITLDHDEYHGSLSSRLAIKYLPKLHSSFPCFAGDAQPPQTSTSK